MARLMDTAKKTNTYKKGRSYTNKEQLRKQHKMERNNRKNGRRR